MEMRTEIDKIRKISNTLNERIYDKENSDIGSFIQQALNLGFYDNLQLNSDNSNYGQKLTFTFNIGKPIKIEEIDEKGVFLTINEARIHVDSKILVAIINDLKELMHK